jgi:NAD(P) transhydrogenase subunit alpha
LAVTIGVPRETFPGERRVALIPRGCEAVAKLGASVVVEQSAGVPAGFPDDQYAARGARLATRSEVFAESDIVLQVRTLGANPDAGRDDLALLRSGQMLIGFGEPLTLLRKRSRIWLARACLFFAMELMPRITRAQSMDALSSMATISGYRAVLLAAVALPKMFPMLMTAAGTMTAAKVFGPGRGRGRLAGHRDGASRLGAVVSAYDVRSAVKEQIESLGAKFVVFDIEAGASEDKGGYAKAMGEDFYRRQREAAHRSSRNRTL